MYGINRLSSGRACTSTKHLNITTTVVTFLDKQLQNFGIFRGRDNCLLQKYIKNTVNNISCRNIMAAPILAPTVKLNNGYEMPVLGLGTYQLKKGKCETIIRQAIKIGYRHVDTAYLYGNEVHIGKSLKQLFEENLVKRSDIFVCTKLWSIFHEPQRVKYACRRQLNDLHLNYIDLYLMHSPIAIKYNNDADLMPHENGQLCTDEVDYVATYKAMEELVSMGWVRSLGLSNFNAQQITRILANCQIKPVVNQVECHPGLNQKKLRTFCQEHDIIICAYSPLARPKLTKPLPEFYNSTEVEQLAEFYGKTKAQIVLRYLSYNKEAVSATKHAIDIGYRHIDTAYFYQNESEIGEAICEKIKDGVVKREDMFVVTKLWNIHHEPERVEAACRKQLQNLRLDYIDLYLMHVPVAYKYVNEETLMPKDDQGTLQLTNIDYLDTYKAMEPLMEAGLVRSLGVSNFNSEQLQRILDNCKTKPVTNQVECSPALNQRKLNEFCKQRGIVLTAYSPLGRPKPNEQKPDFFYSVKTQALAEKYQKTPAQIILRYLIDIGTVPVPKSSNPQRIAENFNVFDFKLTADDIEIMDSFNSGERLVPFNLIKAQNHKYFPFHLDF